MKHRIFSTVIGVTLDFIRSILCAYLVILPLDVAQADRAEDLLGVQQVKPPVRRAIDQDDDNKDAKKQKATDRELGLGPTAQLSDDEILDLLDFISLINKQLAAVVSGQTLFDSMPGPGGSGSAKSHLKRPRPTVINLIKALNTRLAFVVAKTDAEASKEIDFQDKVGGIHVPRAAIAKNPKESMLHLLKSVNEKLAKLFSELGLPANHEVLKKAQLSLHRAQVAINRHMPRAVSKKVKKLKPGFLPVSAKGGQAAGEHFKKRTHSAVVDRLHQPKIRLNGLPTKNLAPDVPTGKIKELVALKTGDLHPKIDLSKIDNVKLSVDKSVDVATGLPKNLAPSIDRIDPKVNQIDKNVSTKVKDIRKSISSKIGKVDPGVSRPDVEQPNIDQDALRPKVPDADQLTPKVDTDKIRKEADVSQKIGKVTENVKEDVNQDVSDIEKKVKNINENIQENVDPQVKKVTENVDGIEKKVEQDVSGIKQNVEQKVNSIKENVSESVDESGLKKQIEDRIASRVNPDLEKVRKKVISATNQAYAGVYKYLDKEISTQKSALIDKYKYEWWDGVIYGDDAEDIWGSEPANWPDWIQDDSKDLTTYKKYYNGRQKVVGNQQNTLGGINSLFAKTEGLLASGHGGSVPDSDDSPAPPRYQQEQTPGSGDDHRRIEINGNFKETVIAPAQVVASIGDRSLAIGEFGSIGSVADATLGSGAQTITVPGVITAAIGYEADAILKVGTLDADVQGRLNRTATAPALVVAAIGGQSDALSKIATISGDVNGNAEQKVIVPSSVVASLGGRTTARFDVGNVLKKGSAQNLKQDITLRSPSINAAIGYRSKAITTIGNIAREVSGNVDQSISVGGIVNASVGSHTSGIISIGDINAKIGGNVKQRIHVGEVLSATVGAGTSNLIQVGAINAPVTGNVDMNVSTGSITAISIGAHTETEAVIGTINAPVYGNANINVHTGSITNFAIGIGVGSGTEISAKTYIGTVHAPIHGNANIDISTGSIFTLGFGIDIDLGPFGELKIVIDGCKSKDVLVGNIGGPC